MGDFTSNLSNLPQYVSDWWNGRRSINPVSLAWNALPQNVRDTYTSGFRSLVDMSTPASIRDYTTSAQDTARSAMEGDGWGTATNALGTVNAALGAIPIAGMGVTLARKGAQDVGKAIGMGVREAVPGMVARVENPLRGYHGSPHNFPAERRVLMPDGTVQFIKGAPDVLPDVPQGAKVLQDYPLGRFDPAKVGTGEGAQAYGHGAAYIAEAEAVGKGYRDTLTKSGREWGQRALDKANGDVDAAIAAVQGKVDRYTAGGNQSYADAQAEIVRALQHYKQNGDFPKGHMYEVAIHADPAKFLDWDKALREQSPEVLKAIKSVPYAQMPGYQEVAPSGRVLEDARSAWMLQQGMDTRGPQFHKENVSKDLAAAGLPGIKYLDQGSRTTGEGSRNYVVFDDNLIEILRKYGLLPVAGGAAAYGATQGGEPQPQGLF